MVKEIFSPVKINFPKCKLDNAKKVTQNHPYCILPVTQINRYLTPETRSSSDAQPFLIHTWAAFAGMCVRQPWSEKGDQLSTFTQI